MYSRSDSHTSSHHRRASCPIHTHGTNQFSMFPSLQALTETSHQLLVHYKPPLIVAKLRQRQPLFLCLSAGSAIEDTFQRIPPLPFIQLVRGGNLKRRRRAMEKALCTSLHALLRTPVTAAASHALQEQSSPLLGGTEQLLTNTFGFIRWWVDQIGFQDLISEYYLILK